MTPLPDDLQKLTDAMVDADARADALAARVNDEEFFWQPDQGRWSIALCLDHLAVANTVYCQAMRGAVDRARQAGWLRRGPGTPGFFGRKFIQSLEPPVKRRTSAPRKIRPRPISSRAAVLQAYHQAHDDLRRLIEDAATIDLDRARFVNPFIGFIKVRVSTGLNVIAAHDRRHLWQAEQVERESKRNSKLQTPNYKLQTPNCKLQTPNQNDKNNENASSGSLWLWAVRRRNWGRSRACEA